MQNYSVNKTPRALVAASMGLVGLTSFAGAQELFGSFSDYSQASGYELQDGALNESEQFDLFKYGVRASMTFDDNIFLSDGGEDSDVIFTTDLILSLKNRSDAANSWVLTYIPSFRVYADNSDLNGVDHNLNAGFSKILPKTQLDFGVDFGKTSGSSRYAGGQIEKTTYGAQFSASHILSGKTRADLDLNFRSDDYDRLASRDIYSARLTWLYQLSSKLNVGPYVGYEFADVDGSNNHKAVSFGGSFEYQALAKTSFNGSFGGESRSFSGSSVDDKFSGVFNLGARHQYSGKTSFDASVYRKVSPSYSKGGNDSYTATGVYLGANYKATQRLNMRSRVNFENSSFFGDTPGVSAIEDNDYFSFSIGGDYAMPCGLNLGADVTFRERSGRTDFSNTLLQVDATYYF